MTELHDLTALEQAAEIRRRRISARELTEHYLRRSHDLGDTVGAFVTIADDFALAQADAADAAMAEGRVGSGADQALHGVVCPVKDLDFVVGIPCRMGSAAFNVMPDFDEMVVTRLRHGGLVFTGKTNTPEMGLPCYTEPEVAPPARTPWDLSRSAGGSSGGAAAAVAAGLAPVAHGNDGGGSVRIPASVTGLVGIKPSRGRVSNGPLKDLIGDLVTHGPLGRTVSDTAALLDVMSGPGVGDPFAAAPPRHGSFLDAAGREPGRLRVGFYTRSGFDVPDPAPEVIAAVEAAARLAADLGHDVDETAPPFGAWLMEPFTHLWSVLAAIRPVDPAEVGRLRPLTRYLRERGHEVRAVDLAFSAAAMRIASRGEAQAKAEFDVLIAPTVSRPPALVGELRNDEDPAADFAAQVAFSPFCAPYNVTGQPAVNVPLNWSDDNLPIGVQLVGRLGEEETIISLAGQFERARPWAQRRPEVW